MSSTPGEPAETAPADAPQRDLTPNELAAQQGVPARGASHYAKGTTANMVRSMAVIVAITLALFFMTGRANNRTPESVDVAGTAQYRAQQAGQPFAHAEGLPDGWVATNVRYVRSKDGVMVWNAGYTTPDGEYVSVQQALDPGKAWVDTQTNNGARVGVLETKDGTSWVKRDREGKIQRSLVHVPEDKGELTTLVTGTGSWEQLELFADHLEPAKVTNPTPSASS
ncbi:DUF4245 domain-containing protein [Janibacter terrae]|uniref:DUF4245 domain-containing protein n=1 Tax=Janibacter terrae TaxID=103817 RepID=UPI0008397432|nr:DUF4245 domain-containing protein [Janibacter terrae]